MTALGTPLSANATRIVLLGSGELGKEVAIEAARLGCEVVAIDRYPNAPAMQVASRSHVIDMTNPSDLRNVLEAERSLPYSSLTVLPELEAIATPELEILEAEGLNIIPTARAARLTMDREGIRKLASEELGLPTSTYKFCDSLKEVKDAARDIGLPCVIKPVMSSSGKGQSVVTTEVQLDQAWEYAQTGGRAGEGRVIIEGFVDFEYEITLLTVRHRDGTSFCAPIGHRQEDGDYRESWQPHQMSDTALARAHHVAEQVTSALGGLGIFGVELFVSGDDVIFSEVSPRPHDTGMVTMATQSLSEFALHVRAVMGLPIPKGEIPVSSSGASSVILANQASENPSYDGIHDALALGTNVNVRIFGKPSATPGRRMGVVLARGNTTVRARELANKASAQITVV